MIVFMRNFSKQGGKFLGAVPQNLTRHLILTSEAEVIAMSNQDDQDMLTIYLNNNYSTGYDEVQVTIQICQHLLMKYLKNLVNSILIFLIFPNSPKYENI